ncbi:hypothetical protein GEMRC1_009602 [Eukaryota sp. GEM-RC1]
MLLSPDLDFRTLCVNASEDTICRAVWTYFYLEVSQETIAKMYCVRQSTISKWIDRVFSAHLFEEPHEPRRKLDDSDVEFLITTVETDPLLYLKEIVTLMKNERNKDVSVSTIHRALVTAGYTHKRCRLLVKRAKIDLIASFEYRLSREIGTIRQYQLLFIDEISFHAEDFIRTCGRALKGMSPNTKTQRLARSQISAVVAMDMNGYVHSHIQYGHFDRQQFVEFLIDLIRLGKIGTSGGSRSKIILDGCSIHRHQNISEGLRKMGIQYFILPPYCPESNCIENFFRSLRCKMRELYRDYSRLNFSEIDFIHRVLDLHLRVDCRPLLNHSGWVDHEYYKSPYLEKKSCW